MPVLLPVKSRASFQFSNALFIASLLCMCMAEAIITRGLFFAQTYAPHVRHRSDLPLLIWTPALGVFLLMRTLKKHVRVGDINPQLAVKLSSGVGSILLVAYLLITRLAQVAFR